MILKPPFILKLSITNDIFSSYIYDKWNDFNFEIAHFSFLDGDVPHSPSDSVYIVEDFQDASLYFALFLETEYAIEKLFSGFNVQPRIGMNHSLI